MIRLAPASEGVAHQAIERILETVLGDDNPPPSCVLIEGPGDTWRRHAALLPVEDRRRAVVAAFTESCLIDAVRFEIGGASWLPVSTPSIEMACEAAVLGDRRECAPKATRGVLEILVADATRLSAIGWRPRSFWSRQVGSRRLCAALTEIANRLECVPAILPGPVLVATGCDRAAIDAVCREFSSAEKAAIQMHPEILDLSRVLKTADPTHRVEDLLECVGQGGDAEVDSLAAVQPVLNLATGERVGSWSLSEEGSMVGSGWVATPSENRPDGGGWDLESADGSRTIVVECMSLDDQENSEEKVIRVPGFIGAELRRGSPAGLLVERWAKHPAREGRPIWVPSVDVGAVRFLLGLPGPIWVDGPGVPG